MGSKDWKVGSIGTGLMAVAMLLCAQQGHQPYAFFNLLRIVVAFACGLNAWLMYSQSKRYLSICLLLALLAPLFLVARMHRHDWAFFDWSAIGVLSVAIVVQWAGLRWRSYRTAP